MSAVKMVGRLAAVAALAVALVAPATGASAAAGTSAATGASAAAAGDIGVFEAPVGVQCGAYRDYGVDTAHLRYLHCGSPVIMIEIDKRNGPNRYMCVGGWQDVFVDHYIFADNAWYVGLC